MKPALVQEIGCAAVTEAFGQMESLVRSHLLAFANTGYRAVKRPSMCWLRLAFGGTDRLVTASAGEIFLFACALEAWWAPARRSSCVKALAC